MMISNLKNLKIIASSAYVKQKNIFFHKQSLVFGDILHNNFSIGYIIYSMCSLAVSTQGSSAVEPRSNPGSGKILMSENLRLYTTHQLGPRYEHIPPSAQSSSYSLTTLS